LGIEEGRNVSNPRQTGEVRNPSGRYGSRVNGKDVRGGGGGSTCLGDYDSSPKRRVKKGD